MRRFIPPLLLALLLIGSAHADTLNLRLLETSDVHMNLLDWDYYQDKQTSEYGLVRTATLIAKARAENPNTLLFDNGDLLQGTPLGDHVAHGKPLAKGVVHPAIRMLNALHYDAANIGNHDFNYGLPALRQAIAGAKFPYLNANVMLANKKHTPAFTPTVLLTRKFADSAGKPHTLKIGLIGLTPPQIMEWDHSNLEGRVTVPDAVETARKLVPRLRAQGADLVIVIAHTGLSRDATQPPMSEYVAVQLAQIPGIDALLLGHQHEVFPGSFFDGYPDVDLMKGTIHGVPAVMPGHWGSHLGLIDLQLNNDSGAWKVAASQVAARPIFDATRRAPLVEADPRLAQLVAPEHQGTLDDMRSPVAQITAPIFSYFSQVSDDPSVQIVSDAQAAYARQKLKGTTLEGLPLLSAAAPFKAGGRQGVSSYTDIPAGTIAAKNVADLYLYPNTVKVVKVTGAEVREWLEMAAVQFRQIDPKGAPVQELLDPDARSYNTDTIDGVTYDIDVTQAARYGFDGKPTHAEGHRIVNLRYQGLPIDEAASFLVVTNNYRASGGGNFPGINASRIVLDAPDETRQALTQYLAAQKVLTPQADGNWHLLPVPGVKLRFVSSAEGVKDLPRVPSVCLVGLLDGGWAQYELRPPATAGAAAQPDAQTACAPAHPAN
ncbi:MAG TPA: bifunctional 2',3'-cyclic-nucleotide 2'-phosphodiesterase/3'-nucleotidase [Burkholderiaceae bacterium]|jgi:2',3'-cyclic-nucleotide 2'-phosphodiesterase/3'-nucleotidase